MRPGDAEAAETEAGTPDAPSLPLHHTAAVLPTPRARRRPRRRQRSSSLSSPFLSPLFYPRHCAPCRRAEEVFPGGASAHLPHKTPMIIGLTLTAILPPLAPLHSMHRHPRHTLALLSKAVARSHLTPAIWSVRMRTADRAVRRPG